MAATEPSQSHIFKTCGWLCVVVRFVASHQSKEMNIT